MSENEPMEIERRSLEIIARELGDRVFPPDTEAIVRRVIHATADFSYADNLIFSPDAVGIARAALARGCDIVTDTTMAQAGINKRALGALGGQAHCYVADEEVAREAQARGVTRSRVAMEHAVRRHASALFVIGNAPTALESLLDCTARGEASPALIVGVPVGFVHVIESKERLCQSGIPFIVARGRKGGSNVAAAICNALLYGMRR